MYEYIQEITRLAGLENGNKIHGAEDSKKICKAAKEQRVGLVKTSERGIQK